MVLQANLLWRDDFIHARDDDNHGRNRVVKSDVPWVKFVQDPTDRFLAENVVRAVDKLRVDDVTDVDRLVAVFELISWRAILYRLITLGKYCCLDAGDVIHGNVNDDVNTTSVSITGNRLRITHEILTANLISNTRPLDIGAHIGSLKHDLAMLNRKSDESILDEQILSSIIYRGANYTGRDKYTIEFSISLPASSQRPCPDELRGSGCHPNGLFSKVVIIGGEGGVANFIN